MRDPSPRIGVNGAGLSASRAIAHEPEVEVSWTADAPSASGNNFRVTMPGRGLTSDNAMLARESTLIASYLSANYDQAVGGPTKLPDEKE